MNERDIELAKQAEIAANKGNHVDVKIMMDKFAELIRADEREACAVIVENMNSLLSPEIAAAIRARGNT